MTRILPLTLRIAIVLVAAIPGAANELEPPPVVSVDRKQGQLQQLQPDERGRLRLAKTKDGYVPRGEFVSTVLDVNASKTTVRWIEQWTTPLSWKKHAGNPIFGPKQTGAWDTWTNGVSVVRNPDGRSYKMFYSGRAGAGIGFAEASLDDPLTWKENPVSPVLKPCKDNWEGNLLNQPRVVQVTATHWRMYYTGWGYKGKAGSSWAFGLAESHDAGRTWKRVGDQPLLERGDVDSPDGGGVFVPEVRRVGDHWMMWYTAMKAVPKKQYIHLCLATSKDGIHWSKHKNNPVVSDDFENGPDRNVLSRCCVRYEHGVFKMWYSHAKPTYRIRYAESLDGIAWERSPIVPVLGPGPKGAWDGQKVEYPEIDVVDGRYRMWFCGNGYGSVGFAEGVAETGIRISLRTGDTPKPDTEWSPWQTVSRSTATATRRFVQLRAELWSKNPKLSPALGRIELLR